MKERHKAVPASYLILRRGGEILLMLRKNTGYCDGWYVVPSGHVEEGEMPMDAVLRETREEIGIDLPRSSVRPVHAMYRTQHDQTGDRADYFFEATDWQGVPVNAEPEKCEGLGWFPLHGLPPNVVPHVKYAIECVEAGIAYSELR